MITSINLFEMISVLMNINKVLAAGSTTVSNSQMKMMLSTANQMNADAERIKQQNLLECSKKAGQLNLQVEGIVVPGKPTQTRFDQQKYEDCVSQKEERIKKVTKSVQHFIEEEMAKPQPKSCLVKMDKSVKECYYKNVLDKIFGVPSWSVNFNRNVGQIWNGGELVLETVVEAPVYVGNKESIPCKTFFKKPSLNVKANALGDVILVEGHPVKKSEAKKCKKCSDYLEDPKTVEGKNSKCSASCSVLSGLLEPAEVVEQKSSNTSDNNSKK